jgi:hemolysin D
MVGIILLIVIAAFAWSWFGKVDEVATARGKIIPDGRVKVIQPMEAGVIKAIHVQEGQKVREGQLLIELDPTIKQADARSTTRTLTLHRADRSRLMAELAGDAQPPAYRLSTVQKQLMDARGSEYQAKEEALILIIAQRKGTLEAAETGLSKLRKTHAIVREQEEAQKQLLDQGYLPRLKYLDKQRELYEAEREMEIQEKAVKQAGDSLEEAKKNLEALKKERERGILSDIVDKEKSIVAMEGEVTKAKKMYDYEKLLSPVDGTVHGLSSYTIGGVVTPAQPIVTIVPEGTPLIVEAQALNKDIGFLRVGQDAEIKLDTFPFQKYGTIKGNVTFISPDAFEDEKIGPVYRVKISIERLTIPVDGRTVRLAPGMAASVEVKTGKRRIIEFFLSPLVKYASESLTVR